MKREGISGVGSDPTSKLKIEINQAKREALSKERFDLIKDQQDVLTIQFLRGEITSSVFEQKTKELDVQEGLVERRGLIEYVNLLEAIGFSEDEVKKTVAHENDHMVEALTKGVDPVYRVQFVRTGSGVGMYPSIHFDFPVTMSEEERRRILREILEAPEELSDTDKHHLGH